MNHTDVFLKVQFRYVQPTFNRNQPIFVKVSGRKCNPSLVPHFQLKFCSTSKTLFDMSTIPTILQMRKLDPSEVSFGQRPANRLNSKAWVSSQVSAPRSPHLWVEWVQSSSATCAHGREAGLEPSALPPAGVLLLLPRRGPQLKLHVLTRTPSPGCTVREPLKKYNAFCPKTRPSNKQHSGTSAHKTPASGGWPPVPTGEAVPERQRNQASPRCTSALRPTHTK